MILETAEFSSPIGDITIAVHDRQLCALRFADGWHQLEKWLAKRFRGVTCRPAGDPAGVVARLRDYFAGDLRAIERIEVDPGGTPFQSRVWEALRLIPTGQTMSYGELARAIGAPSAVRAVGLANGANPVGIVIPCHRVIGADGSLTGYGGGIDRKRWLLEHEGVLLRSGGAGARDGNHSVIACGPET
jgi:methylated-DNA-[protein]-cysteine S-methyltransferase